MKGMTPARPRTLGVVGTSASQPLGAGCEGLAASAWVAKLALCHRAHTPRQAVVPLVESVSQQEPHQHRSALQQVAFLSHQGLHRYHHQLWHLMSGTHAQVQQKPCMHKHTIPRGARASALLKAPSIPPTAGRLDRLNTPPTP